MVQELGRQTALALQGDRRAPPAMQSWKRKYEYPRVSWPGRFGPVVACDQALEILLFHS